jgi:hypothetical protein
MTTNPTTDPRSVLIDTIEDVLIFQFDLDNWNAIAIAIVEAIESLDTDSQEG